MGLDINAVQFLIAARRRGLEMGEVVTLGRQGLNVFPSKMIQLLRSHEFDASAFSEAIDPQTAQFAEPVFKSLGAKQVYSLDASGYEGASFVHDLNQPIPSELRERFDMVYDGGTLEHVFNFPVALKNCMEMVRKDGRLMIHTVTNNYCGHGFYQFSPELFFRALSPEHGFEMERMVIHPIGPYGKWREVSDPASISARVELISWYPAQLLIQARRTELKAVFEQYPQQSDYTPRWHGDSTEDAVGEEGKGRSAPVAFAPRHPGLTRRFPALARLLNAFRMARGLYRSHSIRNRQSFRPVKRP